MDWILETVSGVKIEMVKCFVNSRISQGFGGSQLYRSHQMLSFYINGNPNIGNSNIDQNNMNFAPYFNIHLRLRLLNNLRLTDNDVALNFVLLIKLIPLIQWSPLN